ncbi:hypothetical protein AS034_04295 [[Bacillus] enclensis]|uniref:ABC transporter periplasmic binding protein yphF n=2 Tax=Rossellomorea TaxID=2837508 RepID=A0A0V8HM52_9BACI|nr:hypothetical protein [[Bacillus] enclensis]KSU63479.1 hypothetical protein AS034_04295 [[Bacillus] enclensis]SCB84618.1 hypothetical protein GA0061094_0901 [[Bacillus] enclensis]
MKRIVLTGMILVLTMTVLSGCLYPEKELNQNQIPYDAQVKAVQEAVEQYQDANSGLLPIKTRDKDTPIYQKYPIDFRKLSPQYLSEIPGNAFENGGIFQYVLLDVEENPTVKIFDLRMAEKIREIKIRINAQGYPPFKEQVAHNVYKLNYEEIGMDKEVYVDSPYSNKKLPLVINGSGEIFVDYSMDLYEKLQSTNKTIQEGTDIRTLLTEDSLFVPAYSLPYTIDEKNEPVFMTK